MPRFRFPHKIKNLEHFYLKLLCYSSWKCMSKLTSRCYHSPCQRSVSLHSLILSNQCWLCRERHRLLTRAMVTARYQKDLSVLCLHTQEAVCTWHYFCSSWVCYPFRLALKNGCNMQDVYYRSFACSFHLDIGGELCTGIEEVSASLLLFSSSAFSDICLWSCKFKNLVDVPCESCSASHPSFSQCFSLFNQDYLQNCFNFR